MYRYCYICIWGYACHHIYGVEQMIDISDFVVGVLFKLGSLSHLILQHYVMGSNTAHVVYGNVCWEIAVDYNCC